METHQVFKHGPLTLISEIASVRGRNHMAISDDLLTDKRVK